MERIGTVRERSATAGFTIAEVVVVLAVIGLVLGFVLLKTGLTVSLSSTARQLIGAMRDAFTAAAVTQRQHRLNFDLDAGTYWITQVTPEGDAPPLDPTLARPVALRGAIKIQDVGTWSQGKVSTGRAAIAFFPAGYSEPAVVHLVDGSLNATTLLLNPLTGDVKVVDHYLDPPGPQPIPERLRPWFLTGAGAAPARGDVGAS